MREEEAEDGVRGEEDDWLMTLYKETAKQRRRMILIAIMIIMIKRPKYYQNLTDTFF